MVSVTEAEDIIFSNLFNPSIESVPTETSVNRVLAESILADRDFPPFDRVSMDGIAIQFREFEGGQREFPIEFTHAAGDAISTLQTGKNCAEVMTGAVLPNSTDTVVRYEDLEIRNNIARIVNEAIGTGQNIHRKGVDCKEGDELLNAGLLLSPAEVALLASVGKASVKVFSILKTALISSGDELVDINDAPLPHQIRRSNTYAIEAAMLHLNCPVNRFHFPDDKDILLESLKKVLEVHDILILSGGVSKGKFDFIPKVFEELGVKKLFHQVNQRPGKPFWFGTSKEGKTVFALPGNPVSTYMCFYRYIRPWVLKSMKVKAPVFTAALGTDFSFAPALTYFLQVAVKQTDGKLIAYPDAGGGSGDFVNLKNVTGFLQLPAGKSSFRAGEVFPYFPFRALL